MNATYKQTVLAAVLASFCALTPAISHAQDKSASDTSLTHDANIAAPSGSGAVKEAPDEQAELAKKLNNPVADLISVPIQNNWDFGIGPANAMKYTCNIQPVVPVSVSDDWNLIIRTIMPVIHADAVSDNPKAPASARESHSGLGDITQSFFLSPKEPVGGWILGAGPVGYYPTATDSELGQGKWGAGPTIVALRQEHGFTYGVLANHIWSVSGWGPEEVNATFIQPFVSYTTKTYTTFGVNTESTYDWHTDEATVPMNFTIQQLVKIGKMPIAFQVGYRYYIEKPDGGPDWGLRFAVTFLFPKK